MREGRKPQPHSLLSGVVQIRGDSGPGYAFIRFTEDFVDAVGRALPHGLSPAHPAYLKLLYMPGREVWRLFALYLYEERGVLLWETAERPHWVGKIRQP